jgi:RNA polymerase sigma-70 factor (ECF subfamily)
VNHPMDEELIARCARGDRQAMDMLVCRYHGKVLDFAFRHLRDREASADIAQLTLIRVFESAGSYRLRASFKSWLYTIALNLVRDECRRRSSRKESTASELEAVEDLMSVEVESAEDAALDRMAADDLWESLDRIPENWRSAIILKYRQGLTYEEIAVVMGVPSGTAKSWIHFALKALRQQLQPVEC